MVWNLLTPTQYTTSSWSGGTTTQLAIYPVTAAYANRDFLWRLSSAKVEQATSVFTPLPDYHRFLTVLRGTLNLKIGCGDRVPLQHLEVRAFSGGDRVESWGICTDFNLMIRRSSCEGEMHALRFDGKTDRTATSALPANEKFPQGFLALYCAGGAFAAPATGLRVAAGELLLCRDPEPLRLIGEPGTAVIAASIRSRP